MMMFREVGGYRVFRVSTVEGQTVDVLPVGVRELAERYGIRRAAVGNWARRYPDFPDPLIPLAATPVYDAYAIDRWRAGRGFGLSGVSATLDDGSVVSLARTFPVDESGPVQ